MTRSSADAFGTGTGSGQGNGNGNANGTAPTTASGSAWTNSNLLSNDVNSLVNPSRQSIKTSYTTEEMLQVYHALQEKLQADGFEEKYRSLQPIRDLVDQVERDRIYQQNNWSNSNSNGKRQNGHHNNRSSRHVASSTSDVDVITEKLNEINQWATKEQNGLDFTSILNNVASKKQQQQQQQQQQQLKQTQHQSPFINNSASIHMQREYSSLSNLNSPLASPHPLNTSFAQPQQTLIPPTQINWYYIDSNGTEQGPFDGPTMQSWYSSGYIGETLQLRREGEVPYTLFSELITRLGTLQPFMTPLPPTTSATSATPTTATGSQFSAFESQIPGLFDQHNLHQQGFLAHPQAQLGQYQATTQNAWNMGNSGRSSPWAQPAQTSLQMDGTPVGNDFFTSSNLFAAQSNAATSAGNSAPQPIEDDLFNQIQSQVLGGDLKEDEVVAAPVTAEEKKASKPVVPVEQSKTSAPAASKAAPAAASKKATTSTPAPAAKTAQPAAASKAAASKTEKKTKPVKITTTSESTKAAQAEAKSTPAAPWAAHASTYTTPQLTLDQIQKIEAEERALQEKIRSEKAAVLLAATEKNLKEQEIAAAAAKRPALPATSSWATVTPVEKPTKTLADIQREEAEAAARAAKQASASYAAHSKNSFASIANTTSNAVSSQGGAWTTVTSKKPQQKPQSSTPTIHTTSKAHNPDVLRSVSAAPSSSTFSTTNTSSLNRVSPRQEFLSWCRSTLKLNKGVKTDDILEILLMFPAGAESQEIIADTVYSNSSTMDGRRFAVEFMKRKKVVEDQVHDGLSWNEALLISANDDDDGWDFQVVKKKGKKRTA
ncbi:CYFA0S05e02212g1_1 [Cyberlindnera fabianii]|uniref:CYFA0S05e02212g1_1 n=1 Tax=Cyberlindnera fabianii TaxID=36022 RepID=A0A061ATU3_CYBFA|nr:CYFA0S05e02212g1_1 [Cyberlindnera fabianii]